MGNYKLALQASGQERRSFYWTVRVDEVRYNEYAWDEVKAEITPEKRIQFTLSRPENVPYSRIRITNNVTGWTNSSSGTYGTYTVTDTTVQPEQYYTYTVESVFGGFGSSSSGSIKTPYTTSLSLTVPSEATLAKEAAEEAKATSLLVKADTEYIKNNMNDMQTDIVALKNQVSNLQTSIDNNTGPQIYKVTGLLGATCTVSNDFPVMVTAPGAIEFRVKADTGTWSPWRAVNTYATATGIISKGAHTINIEARNDSGATSSSQMTIFKL